MSYRISTTYTLSGWGSSRSTVIISSTVLKHFAHQFNTFVDLLKGYMGKPYLSFSWPQFRHILLWLVLSAFELIHMLGVYGNAAIAVKL